MFEVVQLGVNEEPLRKIRCKRTNDKQIDIT